MLFKQFLGEIKKKYGKRCTVQTILQSIIQRSLVWIRVVQSGFA